MSHLVIKYMERIRWAVQKRMTRSRCHFRCVLGCARGTTWSLIAMWPFVNYWPVHLLVSVSSIFFRLRSTRQLSYPWQNHILDLLITCAVTSLAPAVSLIRQSPSDHFLVFTKLSLKPTPLPPPTLHSFQRFHSIDIGSFVTDFKSPEFIMDPAKSLDRLQYHSILSTWQACYDRRQNLHASFSI